MSEAESPEIAETPEYDQVVVDQGDPQPVLASLCSDLGEPPVPCIEQAHPELAAAPEDEPGDEPTLGDDVSEATA